MEVSLQAQYDIESCLCLGGGKGMEKPLCYSLSNIKFLKQHRMAK